MTLSLIVRRGRNVGAMCPSEDGMRTKEMIFSGQGDRVEALLEAALLEDSGPATAISHTPHPHFMPS
jgi:hypothetical protein